jgi:hypothetical protein
MSEPNWQGPPTDEEVAAHAKAHPDFDGGLWLIFDGEALDR